MVVVVVAYIYIGCIEIGKRERERRGREEERSGERRREKVGGKGGGAQPARRPKGARERRGGCSYESGAAVFVSPSYGHHV